MLQAPYKCESLELMSSEILVDSRRELNRVICGEITGLVLSLRKIFTKLIFTKTLEHCEFYEYLPIFLASFSKARTQFVVICLFP